MSFEFVSNPNDPPPPPPKLPRFAAYRANFQKIPPDLGITACCREVFFVDNNSKFCLVGDTANGSAAAAAADCAVEETQRKTITSTFDGMKKIARHEGPLTLWRGLSATLLMAIPANVIYFTGYDWLRYNPASPIYQRVSEKYAPLVGGSVARVLSGVAVSPIEMFRTRMQSTHGGSATDVFKDTLVGMYRMTQTQGYLSLWRGLELTMWRDVPFSGIYWLGYEALRNELTDFREKAKGRRLDSERSMTGRREAQAKENHTITFVDSFLAGAGSGAVAALVTTPFDVGKTRQQVFRHAGDEPATAASRDALHKAGKVLPEERPMPQFLYHIFKKEGFHGLFKGWIPRCLKVAPACAIMISSYEVGKRWAKIHNEKLAENFHA